MSQASHHPVERNQRNARVLRRELPPRYDTLYPKQRKKVGAGLIGVVRVNSMTKH